MLNVNFVDLWPNVAQYFESNWTMLITSILALLALISVYRSSRCLRMPKLQGPHSGSIFFGNSSKVFVSSDLSSTYRDWERMYGPVYQMPASLGTIHVVLNDPKALTHLFSKDTTTYSEPPAQRYEGRKLFGDMLITLEGETHKRIRRVLSSPLAVSAIRNITPAIFDSAYQLKGMWDSCFQSSDKLNHPVEIDIVKWMNAFTMDNVGKVAFSHDFGNLKGHPCSIMSGLDVYHAVSPTGRFLRISFYAGEAFYKLFGIIIPNARSTQLAEVAEQFKLLTTDFMTKARKAPEDSAIHKSVLGVLLRSVDPSANLRLSLPEATAQALLVMAGYDTAASALTWSLIELSRHLGVQDALRAELRECLAGGERLTYDQLTKDLKYLDAFVSEILRLHPSARQLLRAAAEDDVIPLTDPIRTASGEMIDSLPVRKGTIIRIPVGGVNISEALWGADAGTFDPGRWLNAEGLEKGRREQLPGYRHLLTFGAGPRQCPGRDLAILEIKVALVVLVSHFSFEFPQGPSTELDWQFGRPKVAGEDGPKVPILVRRLTRV